MTTFGKLMVVFGLIIFSAVLIWGGMRWIEKNKDIAKPEVKTEIFEDPYESKPDYPDPRDVFCLTHICKP